MALALPSLESLVSTLRQRLSAALLAIAAFNTLAASNLPPPPATTYVGELLVLDAEQAVLNERLDLERKRPVTTTPAAGTNPVPDKPAAPPRSQPNLVAIYGVEQRAAELNLAGQRARLHVGERDPATGLRLRSIAAPCVSIDWEGETQRLCIGSQ